MGVLFEGEWRQDGIPTDDKGRFQRQETSFRNWITADPSSEFPAEAGRYHLYVSYACPWAHRTLILRELKGLQDMISVSVVHHFMGDDGWTFEPGDGVVPDDVNGTRFLRDVYLAADPHYTGRVTVPVLWDKTRGTIVSNESSEIIRMLNSAFDGIGATDGDYYPRSCVRRSTGSTSGSFIPSITGSTRPGSQAARRPMTRRSANCSTRSTGSKTGCRTGAISWAIG